MYPSGALGEEKETQRRSRKRKRCLESHARRQTAAINYGVDLPLGQGVRFDLRCDAVE